MLGKSYYDISHKHDIKSRNYKIQSKNCHTKLKL